MVAWLIRGVLAVGILIVGLLAVASRPADAPAPTAAGVPPSLTPASVPPSAAAVAPGSGPPAPTAEPFVQRIVSRVARETQAPFPTSTPLPNGAALVSIVDFGYMPGTIRIHPGQTVVWRNDGREEHDVTGEDWHSGPMEPTIEYRQTFGTVGTFTYRCSIHTDMTGIIIVIQ
jgi:plastocyanin